MHDLYALEQPGSNIAVGIDIPGSGTMTVTVEPNPKGRGAVVHLDTADLTGPVELHADSTTIQVRTQRPQLSKSA